MTLLAALKKNSKTLADVEMWAKDGIGITATIIVFADPPLAPIMTLVEKVLTFVPNINATGLQSLVTHAAASQTLSWAMDQNGKGN